MKPEEVLEFVSQVYKRIRSCHEVRTILAYVGHHDLFITAAFTVVFNNCTAFPQSTALRMPSAVSLPIITVISGGSKHAL